MNDSSNCSSDTGWQRLNPVDLALIVVTPSLVAFGVAANSINIVVLTRRWMASSTNNYLTALAVSDTAYLIVFYIITVKFYPGVLSNQWFAHALSYLFPLANLLSNFATWLTCLFTFERWLVIYRPMLGRRHCTKERAKHLICGLFAATALFTLPNFFEYQAVAKVIDCGNFTETVWGIGKTDAYNLTKSLGYYQVFVSIFVFGPLLFLVVFNSLLIRSVVLARRRRVAMFRGRGDGAPPDARSIPLQQPSPTGQQQQKRAHKSANEQQKVTVMLIAVVLLFCMCQLPSAVVTLRKAMQSDEADASGARTLASRLLNSLVNILLLLNAACNFVLYSCFSTRFRDTFRRVFLNCGDNPGGGGGGGGIGANRSWATTGRSAEPSPAASPQVSPRRQAQLKADSAAAVAAAPNSRYLRVPLAAGGEDGTAGSSV